MTDKERRRIRRQMLWAIAPLAVLRGFITSALDDLEHPSFTTVYLALAVFWGAYIGVVYFVTREGTDDD